MKDETFTKPLPDNGERQRATYCVTHQRQAMDAK